MAMQPKITLGIVAAVGAALISSVVVATPSSAATAPKPIKSGGRYLALGDSIAFGYREPTAVNTPNYTDASDFVGYPQLVAQDLNLKLTNAACPGETSASFIKVGRVDNGCHKSAQGTPGYRANFPLHTKYKSAAESQLQFAVKFLKAHPNTKLVTLQIGANDGLRCLAVGNCDPNDESSLIAVAQKVSTRLKIIMHQIRKNAHYKGQLVLVNYYSVNSAVTTQNQESRLLNAVEASVAKNHHAAIANAYYQFAQGSKNAPGNNTCAAGLETILTAPDPNTGNCGIHPSHAGSALIATAVDRVVQKP